MARAEARYRITAEDRTRGTLNRIENRLRGLGRMARAAIGSVATLAGGVGLGLLVSRGAASADQIAKLSDRLGVGTTALQELKFAGEQSGIAFNTLAMGLQRMTRRTAEAAMGTGEAQDAIRELGLDAVTLNKLPLEKKLLRFADAFGKIKDPADKVRLAFKIFDSEGVAFLQLLNRGSKGIREMGQSATSLGLILQPEELKRAEAFGDLMERMKTQTAVLGAKIAIALIPVLERLGDLLTKITGGTPGGPLSAAEKAAKARAADDRLFGLREQHIDFQRKFAKGMQGPGGIGKFGIFGLAGQAMDKIADFRQNQLEKRALDELGGENGNLFRVFDSINKNTGETARFITNISARAG